MSGLIDIKVPDIGDFKSVPVIEVFVKPGDKVKAEDPLISLESDKATMEVPSPRDGLVKSVVVKIGDKVSEGALIVQFEGAGDAQADARPVVSAPASPVSAPGGVAEVRVPDIGDFKDVPVIEIFVKPGDSVKAEDPLIALESDKATMEVPAPLSGTVRDIKVKTGDKVSEGSIILELATSDASARSGSASPSPAPASPASAAAPVAQTGTIDDKADITELEGFRVKMNKELEKSGVKLSLLPFMVKAAVATLQKFPEFNASLDGDALVYKNYWHIGFAADTPNGLMVPVIRD